MSLTLAPELSGVYAAPSDTSELRARAAASAVHWKVVDLAAVHSKKDLLGAFADVLEFPSYFGNNWDALEDCLEDSDCLPGTGHVIHLRNADSTQRSLGGDWDTLLDILREASKYWKGRGKPFVVLIDGVPRLTAWT